MSFFSGLNEDTLFELLTLSLTGIFLLFFSGLSEDTLFDLLNFDRKMLRQRLNILKNDKFLQTKAKMIALDDGKSQREQYYFINYKVNF